MYYNKINQAQNTYTQMMNPIGMVPNKMCPNNSLYTIMPGDTLYNIAVSFGTTVSQIQQLNPWINPYNLRIGQQLCIPLNHTPVCPGGRLYTISPGDTLYAISRTHGVTVEAILSVNKELDPYNLMPGRQICIPGNTNPNASRLPTY